MIERLNQVEKSKTPPKTYQLSDEIFELIFPIMKRLSGGEVLLAQLLADMEKDKAELWKIIFSVYPELREKNVIINVDKKLLTVIQQKERS